MNRATCDPAAETSSGHIQSTTSGRPSLSPLCPALSSQPLKPTSTKQKPILSRTSLKGPSLHPQFGEGGARSCWEGSPPWEQRSGEASWNWSWLNTGALAPSERKAGWRGWGGGGVEGGREGGEWRKRERERESTRLGSGSCCWSGITSLKTPVERKKEKRERERE